MTWRDVSLRVEDSIGTAPLSGVLLRFYDAVGQVFTELVTNTEGVASGVFWEGEYTVRLGKSGWSFAQPVALSVLPEPSLNLFVVKGTRLVPPLAADPRYCACSGHIRTIEGAPRAHLLLRVVPDFDPVVVEGDAIVAETATAKTNVGGFISLNLLRGAMYRILIPSLQCERVVMVPDAPGANLPDMLFPVVDQIRWVDLPVDDLQVAVGTKLVLTPEVIASSSVPLRGTASSDVHWKVSDPSLAGVSVRDDVLEVWGVSPGTVELQAVRRDASIVRIPNTPILGVPLTIQITGV